MMQDVLEAGFGVEDLRLFDPGTDLPPGRGRQLWYLLLVRADVLRFRAFTSGGAPLGPLADVDAYGTDLRNQWQGKSHGVGCRYAERLAPDDDKVLLPELIELWRAAKAVGDMSWDGSPWCAHCGGFAVRALDETQFAHYVAVQRAADLMRSVEWHGRQGPGRGVLGERMNEAALTSNASELAELAAELEKLATEHPSLSLWVAEPKEQADVLARRTRLLADNAKDPS
jgi:hypothetical protein